MKYLFLLAFLLAGCGKELIRADGRSTSDFPTTWAGTITPAQPPQQQQAQQRIEPAPPPIEASATPVPRQPRVRGLVAVLDLTNKLRGADRDQLDGAYFANQVRAEVKRRMPAMGVMTRENILVLLQSGGKTLADCEGECEVDTGRRLGADYVISGDMLKIGSHYKVDLRLHDTHDGQLISGATDSGKTPDELDANIGQAIEDLIKPLR
jgi:TolB-like protein